MAKMIINVMITNFVQVSNTRNLSLLIKNSKTKTNYFCNIKVLKTHQNLNLKKILQKTRSNTKFLF